MDKESLFQLSEEIAADFYNAVNKTYDINEKCVVAKLYNADFQALSNIIFNKLVQLKHTEDIPRINQLQQLHNLKDGWDGCCALKPNSAAFKHTSMLISMLDDNIIESCALFPSNDGGIYIQGKFTKGQFTIFVDNESMTYVISGEKYKIKATDKVNAETINNLNLELKKYI